jgi:predicted MFS family arabinose efflux permease
MLLVIGAAMMAAFATLNSLVQLITTNEMRGRVMSVYNFAFRGGMPMGNFASGVLVKALPMPPVLAADGLLLVLIAIYYFVGRRDVAAL